MYDIQINKLKFIIDNWFLARDNPKEMARVFKTEFENMCPQQSRHVSLYFDISSGLCGNCQLDFLDLDLLEDMFGSFSEYSDNYSYLYPLKDFENYEEMKNYTETPERLELAKHCLEYLTKINENGFKND